MFYRNLEFSVVKQFLRQNESSPHCIPRRETKFHDFFCFFFNSKIGKFLLLWIMTSRKWKNSRNTQKWRKFWIEKFLYCLQIHIDQWAFREFSQLSVLFFQSSVSRLSFFSAEYWILNTKNKKYKITKIIFWEIVVKKMGKSVICLSNSFDETDDIYTTPKRKNIPKISGLSSPSGLCRTPGYGVHSRYTQVSPDSGFELTPSPSSNDKEFKPSSVK